MKLSLLKRIRQTFSRWTNRIVQTVSRCWRDDLTTDQDDAEDVYVDTYTTSKDQGLDRIHVTNLQPVPITL